MLTTVYTGIPDTAHAYIDPGTGSILLQGIVGGAATALVIARMYGARFKQKIVGIARQTRGFVRGAPD